jgi:hypothetical protein
VYTASLAANRASGEFSEKSGPAGSNPKIAWIRPLVLFPATPAMCAPNECPAMLILFQLVDPFDTKKFNIRTRTSET